MKNLNRLSANENHTRPTKIIQFGTGNFLRGFADWMVDILNEESDFDASIQIIKNTKSVSENDLNSQDGLYHTIFSGKMDGKLVNQNRLITCVKSIINPYQDYENFLDIGLEKDLKLIFSNTTEQGIYFDKTHTNYKVCPESFAAKLTALLYHRFKLHDEIEDDAIAILPTELIENNGDILKKVIFQYIDFWNLENEFKQYIDHHIYFYNTLVDRIVPGFPDSEATSIKQQIGFDDKFIVKAEPYYIWVLQGHEIIKKLFPAEKFGLNVQLVADIKLFRTLKVRILNGLHTTMVPVAMLRGLRTVGEVMNDDYCRHYIENVVFKEIIPAMNIDENEAMAYAKSVLDRYENPYVTHLLQSISLNSISKFRVRVLPSILDFEVKFNKLPENLVFSLSSLIVFYKGNCCSQQYQIKDEPEIIQFFNEIWSNRFSENSIKLILENEILWGQNLNKLQGLHEMVFHHVKNIYEKDLLNS